MSNCYAHWSEGGGWILPALAVRAPYALREFTPPPPSHFWSSGGWEEEEEGRRRGKSRWGVEKRGGGVAMESCRYSRNHIQKCLNTVIAGCKGVKNVKIEMLHIYKCFCRYYNGQDICIVV